MCRGLASCRRGVGHRSLQAASGGRRWSLLLCLHGGGLRKEPDLANPPIISLLGHWIKPLWLFSRFLPSRWRSFRRGWCRSLIERRASGVNLEADDGDPEHNQQWIQRSYSALHGWPAFSNDLLNLQAEWRLVLFLQGLMPTREAVLLEVESVVQPQRSRRTKWFVPGAGDDWIFWRAVWTRSLFPSSFEVLFISIRDLPVIFSFFGVLFVRCAAHCFE